MRKLLISFLALVMISAFGSTVYAETITTVTTTTSTKTKTIKQSCHKHVKHKHHAKHKKHHKVYRTYVVSECCMGKNACGCNEMYCYPRYYTCKTEYSYHHGRNSAKVEVCQ